MPAQSWAQPKTLTQWLVFRIFVEKVFETNINLRLGSAIKNLGLFSKSHGDLRIEKMDF